MTTGLTTEDIRNLAAVEREMDAGRVNYVLLNGQRTPLSNEALGHFGLESGQTISIAIFTAILEFNIQQCQMKIAEQKSKDIIANLGKTDGSGEIE